MWRNPSRPSRTSNNQIEQGQKPSCLHLLHADSGSLVWHLVIVLRVQNAQDTQEQIDNIQIQRDRRRNLLLNVVMAHDELRINEDISTENERRNTAINELHAAIVREESSHEPEDDEQPQPAEEVWHPVREIVFGLACKQSQGDEDSERDDEGLHNDARVVEGSHDADGVGF